MPTIESLTHHDSPVSLTCTGANVLERFEREPDTLVLAVVDDHSPRGLIERDPFLLRVAQEGHRCLSLPARDLMDPEPVIVEGSTKIEALCAATLTGRPSDLVRGFVVTREGRYSGTGTVLSLMQAIHNLRGPASAEAAAPAQASAADMAHQRAMMLSAFCNELRTPMNGILAVAELLKRQPLNADAHAYVQTVIDSSESLLGVMQDALDLTRAEAGELALTVSPTPLRDLMDRLHDTWATRAAQDDVRLMVGYEGDTELAALIDAERLHQVMSNLVGHSLRFARKDVVEASMTARAEGTDVVIEGMIRENASQADPALLPGLFTPFNERRADNASGLDLAISQQLMRLMGGEISAEANAGRGVTFTFRLRAPRAWLESGDSSNISQLSDLQFRGQAHILIVDDNATNRVVAQALCEMFGCTSETAEDGAEALEAAMARRFDLILMDIKMPRMDGVQATQAIRAINGPAGETPIIALTANADADDARRYLAAGMQAVVEKPIKPERLRQAMNAALSADAQSVPERPAAASVRASA